MGLFTRNPSTKAGVPRPNSVLSCSSTSTSVQAPVRAVLLGQHPSKVQEVVKLLHGNEYIQLVAAVSDLQDAAVVLKAQVPPVDFFICGAYFELEAAQDIVAAAGGHVQLVKVPDGLMMEGGGPLAVISYIERQINGIRRDSVTSSLGSA